MYKKPIVLFLVVALLLNFIPIMPFDAVQASNNVQNPYQWTDIPDIDVIRVGDAYYMTSTTMHMNPGVPIMKSYDLVHWKIVNYVYDILDDGDTSTFNNGKDSYGHGSWASSLRYNDGKYYIAFASYDTGKTYIYQTTDIENGPWTYSTLDGVYHDMSLIFDNGHVYMTYGSTNINIIELTSDATAIKEGGLKKQIIANASSVAGDSVILGAEGSHIQKIGDYYYIFFITWPNGSCRTELCYRSKTIDGPYEGRVVLQDQGVAQGGIIDTPDGKWYGMLFQDHGSVGRIPYIVPVTWKDEWPVFGVDGKVPVDTGIAEDGSFASNIISSDEFYQGSKRIGAAHKVSEAKASTSAPPPSLPTVSTTSEGIELIDNGGFEDGLGTWSAHDTATVEVTTGSALSGSKSVYVTNRAATGSGVQQYLTGELKAGNTYYFSANIKYDADTAPATRVFNMDYQDGDWQTIKIMGSVTAKKGEWATIKGTYTIPTDAVLDKPRIFVETTWTSAQDKDKDLMNFYVDDVSFIDMTASSNLIKNSGLEKGTDPWTFNDTATVTIADGVSYSGSKSILTTGRKTTGSGPKQFITGKVEAGATYKFSAKVRYDAAAAPATKQFNYDIKNGSSWQGIKVMGSKTVNKGEWGTIEGTYTLPENADLSETSIFLETPWVSSPNADSDLLDFYVDDVTFEKVAGAATSKVLVGENDFNGSILGLQWQWNHNPDNNNWSLTDRNGYLRLTNGRTSASILNARNTLTQRTFGPECSGNIAMDISNMKNGDYAGLAAFQFYYGFVGVKMSGGTKSIVMVKGSTNNPKEVSTPVEVASIPVTQNRVYFKVDFDYKDKTDKAYFYYSLDGINWTAIGDTLQMAYTLPHFMGYRYALFNYATKTTGGYVDFDYFRIDNKIKGATAPSKILNASLAGVSDVIGIPNTELGIPVKMDALPEGDYKSISASFNIPADLAVTGVNFNSENITGNCAYTYSNNQLKMTVSGSKVGFSNKSSDLFATIKLKVNGFVTENKNVEISTDYINVDGGDVAYNVQNAVASIGLKLLDTGALAKIPGYANPLITQKFGADPYAMVYNGRVYIYMTSDAYEYDSNGKIVANSYGKIKTITVVSSDDMVNWTDHGEIKVAGQDGAAKWASLSWAPAAAHKKINGQEKFFLYFANGANGIGVLTSDTPIGPWKDPVGKALITKSTPGVEDVAWLFDPAVLVDDDGTGYVYFGGGIPGDPNPSDAQRSNPKTARVMKLGDDMVSVDGSAKVIDSPYMFEDSGIHKYNNKYYYSYCINFSGTHPKEYPAGVIGYMVSDNAMGPFTFEGTFLNNPSTFFGVGGNNHHCVFEFNGQWYVTYHAQTLRKAFLGSNNVDGYRSTHIDKVEFYENGLMKNVNASMTGVPQIQNLNPYNRTEAETIAWNKGIATGTTQEPGIMVNDINLDVTDIHNGDWIAVSNADFGKNGAATFKANVSAAVGGKIELRLDNPTGEVIGTLDVSPTGGDAQWKLIEANVKNVTGVHNIFFMFSGEGSNNLFNIDYWQFTTKNTEIPVESVSITTGGAISLKVNDSLTLSSTISPSNATDPTYKWTASGSISITGDSDKSTVTIKGVSVGKGTLALTVNAGGVEKKVQSEINVIYPGSDTTPENNTHNNSNNNTGSTGSTPKDNTPTDKPKDTTNGKAFSDIDNFKWAKNAIEVLSEKGIISGTSESTFSPAKKITRADFLVMLVKAMGLKADFDSNFADVNKQDYYYNALGIAKQLGIATGTGEDKFNPRAEITRQDIMVLVAKALKVANKSFDAATTDSVANFADSDNISSYAIDAVATLVKNGIISGDGTNINPKNNATRAETAVIIYKIFDKYCK